MRALIEHLANMATTGARITLVVGASNGADLPALRRLGSTRLVLAEANPHQAGELERHVDAKRGEEVWALAITAEPQTEATLHLVNNPRHSSLKPIQGLELHFPNLRPAGEARVPARSIVDAVKALDLGPDGDHVLVLDAPGQAADLLGLLPPEQAQAFAWIAIRTSSSPLYQGERSREETLALLEQAGFEVHVEDPEPIHPYGGVLARRDARRVEIGRLRARLRDLEGSHSGQSKRLAEQEARIEILTKERDESAKLAAQHKSELDKVSRQNQERGARIDQLDAEWAGRIDVLTKERDEARAQVRLGTEMDSQLRKLTQERDEQAKLAAQYKAELDKVSKQNQERGARIAQLENEHAELSQRQTLLGQEMIKAEAQIDLIKDVLLRDPSL